MIFRKDKTQAPLNDGRMRVQARFKPETYKKLVEISGDESLMNTLIRLVEQEHARIATPVWRMERDRKTAADDAVHRSIMAAFNRSPTEEKSK